MAICNRATSRTPAAVRRSPWDVLIGRSLRVIICRAALRGPDAQLFEVTAAPSLQLWIGCDGYSWHHLLGAFSKAVKTEEMPLEGECVLSVWSNMGLIVTACQGEKKQSE